MAPHYYRYTVIREILSRVLKQMWFFKFSSNWVLLIPSFWNHISTMTAKPASFFGENIVGNILPIIIFIIIIIIGILPAARQLACRSLRKGVRLYYLKSVMVKLDQLAISSRCSTLASSGPKKTIPHSGVSTISFRSAPCTEQGRQRAAG